MNTSVFKIALLGDGATGKTSILRAKSERNFRLNSKMTIGVDVDVIPFETIDINESSGNLLAMDLGGQPHFHFMHDAYILGIKCAIIVYDMTRYITFLNLTKWFAMVEQENKNIPIILVGTKLDLVPQEKIQYFKNEWNHIKVTIPTASHVIAHLFVSSKSSQGIDELFLKCQEIMIRTYRNRR
jgi:Ras-related protein Rab-11A